MENVSIQHKTTNIAESAGKPARKTRSAKAASVDAQPTSLHAAKNVSISPNLRLIVEPVARHAPKASPANKGNVSQRPAPHFECCAMEPASTHKQATNIAVVVEKPAQQARTAPTGDAVGVLRVLVIVRGIASIQKAAHNIVAPAKLFVRLLRCARMVSVLQRRSRPLQESLPISMDRASQRVSTNPDGCSFLPKGI